MNWISKFFMFYVLVLLVGCATVIGDSADEITIESEPSGAEVVIHNGDSLGVTPLKATFPRKLTSTTLIFSKKGYEKKFIKLDREFNTTSLWNIGFITTTSGITSWGVDLISGKMFLYSPRKYVIELEKQKASLSPSALEYTITNFENLRSELVRNVHGQRQLDLCKAWEFSSDKCQAFWTKAYENREELIAAKDSLVFYRQLKKYSGV